MIIKPKNLDFRVKLPNVSFRPPTGAQTPDWLDLVPGNVRDLVSSHLPLGLRAAEPAGNPTPDGARFLSSSFSNAAGTRPYRLYIPASYRGEPLPLVVMLHGCTQSPEDFAAGTGMNEAAERSGCLVAYPGQTMQANVQKCWQWFNPQDQRHGSGEPSLIAGITRQVMQDYAVDPRRVYVAGLSAGGAAAAIMGAAYPDLYAAIGVHSGLACGAARDLPTALAAMKGGARATPTSRAGRVMPAIVFHGTNDGTVSPSNGEAVVEQSAGGAGLRREVQRRRNEGGRACTRTTFTDAAGRVVTEHWLIHGAGHAWSGGRAAGSYTDPSGPDATAEMLRFFGEHARP
ncbi:MAG: PHB depolymerase family esterase [Acetobacteraceae bacterium]|nr:PHB depolymerase family esterase [Acetobacteraceae bacterium]